MQRMNRHIPSVPMVYPESPAEQRADQTGAARDDFARLAYGRGTRIWSNTTHEASISGAGPVSSGS